MNIKSISILTEKQLEDYHFYLPDCNCSYWINSKVKDNDMYPYQLVADCYNVCHTLMSLIDRSNGVRPILTIEGLKRKQRDKFTLFDISWTVIDTTEENIIAISDEVVFKYHFDTKSSDWEKSELKNVLEKWLMDVQEKYKDETIKPTYEELQEKLKELEKRIEEGRLVDVSFVPGDKIWFINYQTIFHGTVKNVQYNAEKESVIVSGITDDDKPFFIDKDNVYTTKEEIDEAFFKLSPF